MIDINKINNKIINLQKQKRKPSAWQLYLKECMPSQSKDTPFPDKVTACSVKYKEIKVKNPKYLTDLAKGITNTKGEINNGK